MATRTSAPRLPLIDQPTDPAVAEVFDSIHSRTGRILNLHRILGYAPKLMNASGEMALALRNGTELPRTLIELLILRTAQLLRSDYEWQQHHPMALSCGVTQPQIDALDRSKQSPQFSEAEKAALAFCESVVQGSESEPQAFARLQAQFSPREIVELTMAVCHYIATARFVQALGIPLEGGAQNDLGARMTGAEVSQNTNELTWSSR